VPADVPKSLRCVSSELFAPVTFLCSYKILEEAIRAVNDSSCGLHAGIFTRNSDTQMIEIKLWQWMSVHKKIFLKKWKDF
jgi:acyl-CoA reductase-like NAD-dependent aldehyde dehydrogenase